MGVVKRISARDFNTLGKPDVMGAGGD